MPKEISDALSADEKKRQEVIYELVYTEKDFVNDLKYLNDVSRIVSIVLATSIAARSTLLIHVSLSLLEMDCAHSNDGYSA